VKVVGGEGEEKGEEKGLKGPKGLKGLRQGLPWRSLKSLKSLKSLLLTSALALIAFLHLSRLSDPEPSLILLDRHGLFLGEIADEPERGYGFWRLDEVPERVALATLLIEDRRFFWHPGVDPLAIGRALRQNFGSSERVSGASTLAMQIARLEHPGSRSYARKALEAVRAIAITLRHGRQDLLRHYLRLVPYGNQAHGIAYAARRYLDKPVADLSWAETAFLVAIPQSPARMNPFSPRGKARAIERGRRILKLLHEKGALDESELVLANAEIAAIAIPARQTRPPEMLHALLDLERQIADSSWRTRIGGRTIVRTTFDLEIQRNLAWRLLMALERFRPRGAGNAALLVVDAKNFEVVAALGSADYFDSRGAGAIDFLRTPRSSGSTLKPFFFALALERGLINPASVLDDLRRGPGAIGNSDGLFLGPMLPRQALANSRNVPAATLLAELGLGAGYDFLGELGLHQNQEAAERFGLGLTIGSLPVKLLDLVRAYTLFPGEGVLHELRFLPEAELAPPRRLLSATTTRLIGQFLADPSARLPVFPRLGHSEYPFEVAVKTGTSSSFRDAWAIAYSERYLVGAWLGHPDQRPMAGLTGYLSAAELVQEVMFSLHPDLRDGQTLSSLPTPADHELTRLCPISGKRATQACPRAVGEWLAHAESERLGDCQVHQRLAIDRRNGLLADSSTPARDVLLKVFTELPPRYAAFAAAQGLEQKPSFPSRLAELLSLGPPGSTAPPRLRIRAPIDGQRLLFDPETPRHLATVALEVEVEPAPAQILWLVNGQPFELKDFPFSSRWPLERGRHVIQAQLPLTDIRSAPVRIVVE
jgi:penicillin-binding protein 1C